MFIEPISENKLPTPDSLWSDSSSHSFRETAREVGLKELSRPLEVFPRILDQVPIYDLEQLATVISQQESGSTPVALLGFGQDGKVYGLKLHGCEFAFKLYHFAGVEEDDVRRLFIAPGEVSLSQLIGANKDKETIRFEVDQILLQTAGQVLGHVIEPDYVDEPDGMIVYQGKPIGFIMPWYHGKAVPINEEHWTNKEYFLRVYHRLNRGGASLDGFFDASNSVIMEVGKRQRIKFVDITANNECLQIDPHNPEPGAFYVPNPDPDIPLRSGPFDNYSSCFRYTYGFSSYEKITELINRYESAVSADRDKLTFEDVCEGRAVVTTQQRIAKTQVYFRKIEGFFSRLRSVGVDPEKVNGEYVIGEEFSSVVIKLANGEEFRVNNGLNSDIVKELAKRYHNFLSSS